MAGTGELGNKHECESCGTKFYDLGVADAPCPKCGQVPGEEPTEEPEKKDKGKKTKKGKKAKKSGGKKRSKASSEEEE